MDQNDEIAARTAWEAYQAQRRLTSLARQNLADTLRLLVDNGASKVELARVLGISRQAVHEFFREER